MRMLQRYASRAEAMERAAFLQSQGIATHVSDMTAMRVNLAHQGLYRAGLWVVFEAQYDDAQALLNDPDHAVQQPLDAAQMAYLETQGEANVRLVLIKWSLLSLLGLAALAGLVVLFQPG